jgi:hypothetical protein
MNRSDDIKREDLTDLLSHITNIKNNSIQLDNSNIEFLKAETTRHINELDDEINKLFVKTETKKKQGGDELFNVINKICGFIFNYFISLYDILFEQLMHKILISNIEDSDEINKNIKNLLITFNLTKTINEIKINNPNISNNLKFSLNVLMINVLTSKYKIFIDLLIKENKQRNYEKSSVLIDKYSQLYTEINNIINIKDIKSNIILNEIKNIIVDHIEFVNIIQQTFNFNTFLSLISKETQQEWGLKWL